jgi:hypothetical protein
MPHPSALYPAPVGSVDLNARFVHWKPVPQQGRPVIRIEPDGFIHALAPGEARVEARFGHTTASLHVIVRATQQ